MLINKLFTGVLITSEIKSLGVMGWSQICRPLGPPLGLTSYPSKKRKDLRYLVKCYSLSLCLQVQVIPWSLMNSNHVLVPAQKLDPNTTVFVGALHGMLTAEGLFAVMNDLFGGVVYAGRLNIT